MFEQRYWEVVVGGRRCWVSTQHLEVNGEPRLITSLAVPDGAEVREVDAATWQMAVHGADRAAVEIQRDLWDDVARRVRQA